MINLFKHQQEILDLNPKCCGLWFGTGIGKTLTAIKLIEKNCQSALIICPKSLVENWREEIKKFKEKEVEWIIYSKEQFKKHLQDIKKVDGVVCDEAHYLFNYKSQLFKAVVSYLNGNKIAIRYLLTATPYLSSSWNTYSAGLLLGKQWKWYKWKNKFFYDIKIGNRRVPVQKKGIENEIAHITQKMGYVKKLEECADVPESIYIKEYFELVPEQNKAINSLIDLQAIVRFTKIHQIENGCLKSDGYVPNAFYECEKNNRILELCQEHNKIAFVCRYNLQIKQLYSLIRAKNAHRPIFIIDGSTKDKHATVEEINAINDAVVLIQASVCEGYNMWSVPIMVFVSNSFIYKDRVQMEGRVQRISHLKKNIYIDLITKGQSFDKAVLDCLNNKKDFDVAIYEKKRS